MQLNRRALLELGTCALAGSCSQAATAQESRPKMASELATGLKIKAVTITPIALPDPPLLAASGCHGPYFLRNIVEIQTDGGIVGIGETHGGQRVTDGLVKARDHIVGQSALAYRRFAAPVLEIGRSVYAGVELACLDAVGRATGLRLCDLLGGPVRDEIEFAAYLFFRYAADHPKLLADPRIVDGRGQGDKAIDQLGEVRTPEAMANLAWEFHQRFGYRVHKLKAGVLPPDVELEALRAISAKFDGKHRVRIDPNGRWTVATALRIGQKLKDLPLEYYEDPVDGQEAMADVRAKTGLRMSTNSCVTAFSHIPRAVETRPIDVVLCDHHGWGGITACQTLGTMSGPLGWVVSQHSNNHAGITMAAMIHVAAVVPELTVASDTHYPWLVSGADVIQGGNLPITSGKMQIPKQPGVGVEIDRDKLAKAHETYLKCGMRQRDDAATMRLVEPGWSRELF
ncbi:MAG TPA: enolase C-terminal domain-like protein [Pirellulaceae bacterium]|nr:enolase C-terminal domain-like protein [Pirellulaceae bacterium]